MPQTPVKTGTKQYQCADGRDCYAKYLLCAHPSGWSRSPPAVKLLAAALEHSLLPRILPDTRRSVGNVYEKRVTTRRLARAQSDFPATRRGIARHPGPAPCYAVWGVVKKARGLGCWSVAAEVDKACLVGM